MRTLPLLIFFVFLSAVACAQAANTSHTVDSLLKVLSASKNDTEKRGLLYDLSWELAFENFAESIKYGEESLLLSQKIHSDTGISYACYAIGFAYYQKGIYDKALQYYFKALKIDESLPYSYTHQKDISIQLSAIGDVYAWMGYYSDPKNYRLALRYDSAALQVAQRIGHKERAASSLQGLGIAFHGLHDYNHAMECYTSVLTRAEEEHDLDLKCDILQFMAEVYMDERLYSQSLSCNFQALRLNEVTGNEPGAAAIILEDIGQAYLRIVTDGLPIIADSLVPAGRVANLKNAREYLRQSLVMAEGVDLVNTADTYAYLSQANELLGDPIQALADYKQSIRYRDSAMSNDVRLKVAAAETQRQTELKEQQIQLNKLAAAKTGVEHILFGAGLIILALVIAGIFWGYRNQKKTNLLQQTALKQKEMLMKEIHHRVKNNLQVISSLLDMQLQNINDERAKSAMNESITRLKAILLIHQQLYRGSDVATLEASPFVADLFKQVTVALRKPGINIVLHNNIPPITIDIDTAVPLGLILNELMTNSYKYAFGASGGSITVSLEQSDTNYKLFYTDSGPGLPGDGSIKVSTGLGMTIIKGLSRQLGGSIDYDKMTKTFILLFKDLAGRKMIK